MVLTAMAASAIGETRRATNMRCRPLALLGQPVYARLACDENVNDAGRLGQRVRCASASGTPTSEWWRIARCDATTRRRRMHIGDRGDRL
jgi:hypothetical protein